MHGFPLPLCCCTGRCLCWQEKLPTDDTYVVQRGDTLAGVALRLGVKQSELKRANRMYGSRTLVPGQVNTLHFY